MVGIGEAYMGVFTLSYGFSERFSGLVVVLPLGIASIIQLFSPKIFSRIQNRKTVVVTCAFFQAISLLLLLIQPAHQKGINEGLILVLTCYWFFALSAGPPWNAWIVSIISKHELKSFFANRGVLHQVTLIFSLLFGGWLLSENGGSVSVFSILFCIAGVARLISTIALSYHPPDSGEVVYSEPLDFKGIQKWLTNKNVLGVILFVGLFRFGVAISSPFFTPFVLKKLQITYSQYMVALVLPFISRAAFYYFSEKVLNYLNIQKTLMIHLSIVAILPLTWSIAPKFEYLMLFQLLSGIGWAGFEYALLFRQIEDFDKQERSRILTWTNFVIGSATILGVVLGAQILGKEPDFEDYNQIFYWSALIRISPLIFIFLIDWKDTRFTTKKYFFRIIGVRPTRGPEVRPVLYTKEDDESES